MGCYSTISTMLYDSEVLLAQWGAYWDDHPAVGLELLQQLWRDVTGCRGNDNPIEWGRLWPSEIAVTNPHRDVRVP